MLIVMFEPNLEEDVHVGGRVLYVAEGYTFSNTTWSQEVLSCAFFLEACKVHAVWLGSTSYD